MNSTSNRFSCKEKGNKIYISKVALLLREGLRARPEFISRVSYCIIISTLLLIGEEAFSQQKDSLLTAPIGSTIDSLFGSSEE